MELKRAGSQPSAKGPAEWFTGTVRIDPLHSASQPARVSCAAVTFEPGALQLAYTPAWPDPDHHGRLRLDTMRRRRNRRDPSGRRDLVPARS
jgi:hypothetical protein